MKRRDLLKTGLLASVFPTAAITTSCTTNNTKSRAKKIIFFAYDGFTWDDFGIIRDWKRRNGGTETSLEKLMKRGVHGSMDSSALTSMVTDSAAATTAWATGRKIVSGSLSWLPNGTELTTIFDLAKAKNMATGVITSTRVTHATPAGWYAKIDWRRNEEAIALQLLDKQPDIILGGGNSRLAAESREDGRDLYADFSSAGYTIAQTPEQLQSANGNKLMGIFSDGYMPYEIDRKKLGLDVPNLAEMTKKGLDVLTGKENGFVLQVEAGRIDHANHANDAASSLHEMIAAEETLDVLLDYVNQHPDTLLIMASDHGTGGGSVYGVGERYRQSSEIFDLINKPTASFDMMLGRMGNNPSVNRIKEIIREGTTIPVSDQKAGLLQSAIRGENAMTDMQAFGRQPRNTLGYILTSPDGTYENPKHLNIKYVSGQHTAAPVPWAAVGAGVEQLPKGIVDNTDFFTLMRNAIGEDFENQSMTAEAALEFYS